MSARPGYIRPPESPLGPRTLEHLRHAAEGRSEPETATLMWVTVNTVKSARKRIFCELGARNMTHAVHLAHEKGLL